MWHSDFRARIWQEHESMYLSYLVSIVQAGGRGDGDVMVWGIFLYYTLYLTLGPLIPIKDHLNTVV